MRKKLLKFSLIFCFCLTLALCGLISFLSNDFSSEIVAPTETTSVTNDTPDTYDDPDVFDDSVFVTENWIDKASENYAGGSGTMADPYQISKAEELALLAKNCKETVNYSRNKHFILTKNIELNDGYFDEDGTYHDGGDGKLNVWHRIGNTGQGSGLYFKNANFDGQNYEVSGLYMNSTESYSGLFGIASDVVIKNLKVKNAYVFTTGVSSAGIIGSVGMKSQVDNCVFEGFVSGQGSNIGGIAGITSNDYVELTNCENYGKIYSTGTSLIGGVLGGSPYKNVIKNCKNFGDVNAPKAYNVGGIAGQGYFENCVNFGNVSGDNGVGGIAGHTLLAKETKNYGSISARVGPCGGIGGLISNYVTNSVNYGNVLSTSGSNVGGIAGQGYATIIECSNFAQITGKDRVGGIVGFVNRDVTIGDCKNYGDIIASSYSGGVVGVIQKGTIQFCSNLGEITVKTTKYVGGITYKEGGEVINCISTSCINKQEANEIHATDLRHFYVEFKTGKVGLRKDNSTASFLGEVTEQYLEHRGFKIYM